MTPRFLRLYQRPCNTTPLCQLTCLSSPCAVCPAHAVTSLLLTARRDRRAARQSESSPLPRTSFAFPSAGRNKAFSAGEEELAPSRICQTPNCIYTTQTLSILGHVDKRGRRFALPFAPLRFPVSAEVHLGM